MVKFVSYSAIFYLLKSCLTVMSVIIEEQYKLSSYYLQSRVSVVTK